MSMFSKVAIASPAVIGVMAVTLMAASPADAQSRYRDRGDDRGQDALVGAVVGGLAGALIGNGDGTYIAGGALAGAAVGAVSSNNRSDCGYYRGGQCYRNQGHWEREHGINRNYDSGYRYDRRYDNNRYDRRDRDYRYDRRW